MAMLASIPVKVAYDHYHEKLWDRTVNVEWILRTLGLDYRRTFYEGGTLNHGFVYLVVVPSANECGQFHQIIVDCRTEPLTVLDPCKGLPDRYYYAWQPEKGEDPWALPLTSWLTEYEVVPHDQCESD